jgi:hypothetical protein
MALSLTADSSSSRARAFTHTLRGTKDPAVTSVTVDGTAIPAANLTSESWYYPVRLLKKTSVFEVVGSDGAGASTETLKITVALTATTPELLPVHGVFDVLGQEQGLPRLPGEKNSYYRKRLYQASNQLAGPTHNGLLEGLSLELGLEPTQKSFTVKVLSDSSGNPRSLSAAMTLRSTYAAISADEILVTDENHRVEYGSRVVTLDFYPRFEMDVRVYTEDGTDLPVSQYKVDRRVKQVRFVDPEMEGQRVRFSYQYEQRLTFTEGMLLRNLVDWLNTLTVGGEQLLTAVWFDSDDGRAVRGLPFMDRLILSPSEEAIIPSYRVQFYPLHDRDYMQSLLVSGSAESTKLDRFASRLAAAASQTWGQVVLDRTSWVSDADDIRREYLPPQIGASPGFWISTDLVDTKRYTWEDFKQFSGLSPADTTKTLKFDGVSKWKSVVGRADDLMVQVVETEDGVAPEDQDQDLTVVRITSSPPGSLGAKPAVLDIGSRVGTSVT